MPKKIYDIESLLADVEAFLKADLNDVIDTINAEEADGIDLKNIDNEAYFLQELNSKVANWNPIVLYGCSNLETVPNGPEAASVISIEILIIFEDSNSNEVTSSSMMPKLAFRYTRALKEVVKNNWTQRTEAGKLYMEDLLPIPYTKLNSSKKSRATGIKITTSIA